MKHICHQLVAERCSIKGRSYAHAVVFAIRFVLKQRLAFITSENSIALFL